MDGKIEKESKFVLLINYNRGDFHFNELFYLNKGKYIVKLKDNYF